MMTFLVDGPLRPTSASAKTNIGKAWTMSAIRMISVLAIRPGAIALREEAGDHAQRHTADERDDRRDQRDRQIDPRRGHHAREDVHARNIGAEPVRAVRRDQAGAGGCLGRKRRDRRPEGGEQTLRMITQSPNSMPGRRRAKCQRSVSRRGRIRR